MQLDSNFIASQSTPTVGDSDWRRQNGCGDEISRTHINDSAVNLIHSNSLSISSSGSAATPSQARSLQRHVSCPRPTATDTGPQFSPELYFNRQHQQMLQQTAPSMPLYAPQASLNGGQTRREVPPLRRQLSDRYQYNQEPTEVDSMG